MALSNRLLDQTPTRRGLIAGAFATAGGAVLMPVRSAIAQTVEEPKSTHTWLELGHSGVYNFDVNVRIDRLPYPLDARWLYFPSLQVNFNRNEEWAHGGVQWAGGAKKINWGGGSDSGYGKTHDGREMRILQAFDWSPSIWYRYRVWRLPKDDTGYYRWLFAIHNYSTGQEQRIGTLRTVSEMISGAVVWIETGYGVRCDTQAARVSWHNPVYRCSTPGVFTPRSGTTSYNGTCTGVANTNQWLISSSPPYWVQSTNTPRTTPAGVRLWG
jgi:hypothetical protein